MNKKVIVIVFSVLVIISIFRVQEKYVAVEDLDIPAGIGVDVMNTASGQVLFEIPVSVYNFEGGQVGILVTTSIRNGVGSTIGNTREDRQRKSNKKLLIGVEKVYILSEEYATLGLNNILDIIFANTDINDMGEGVVCKGHAIDILKIKVQDYPSSSDYIQGMIRNSKYFNFFGDNYKLIDLYIRGESEGRNIVLPYLENTINGLEITGMALFKNKKMVQKIDMEEARVMSMLREDKSDGVITLQKSPKEYIDVAVKVKRKAKCKKVNDKFEFVIELKATGDVINNEMYKDLIEKGDVVKQLEQDLAKKMKKDGEDFIKLMKESYQVDCLQLGRVAAAKYGRLTGADWDKVVLDSNIKVDVKLKINNFGRGDY